MALKETSRDGGGNREGRTRRLEVIAIAFLIASMVVVSE